MDTSGGLLTPGQRERRDLGYLTLGPTFGVNFLTALHGPTAEKGLGLGPRVTFYAQPTAPSTPIDLGKLSTWLDPNLRRYEPAKALQFIPHYRRGFADGIVSTTDEPEGPFDRLGAEHAHSGRLTIDCLRLRPVGSAAVAGVAALCSVAGLAPSCSIRNLAFAALP